jgi:hypothetical protein
VLILEAVETDANNPPLAKNTTSTTKFISTVVSFQDSNEDLSFNAANPRDFMNCSASWRTACDDKGMV